MNGNTLVGGGTVDTSGIAEPGVSWTEIGAANLSGDGHHYVLFQGNDGEIAIADLFGSSGSAFIYPRDDPGPSWKALGTGDFNGDGISDILLAEHATARRRSGK